MSAPAEVIADAERERHALLTQAAREHLDNLTSEARRYQRDLERIESVYKLRTGEN
jgi:hypothetical protein